MAADRMHSHPTLLRLASRVRTRWLLRVLRQGLLVSVVGVALIGIVGRLSGAEGWPMVAVGWAIVSMAAALGVGVWRAPNEWAVAREADALGLSERVTSSLHARASGASVAELVELDARSALDGLDPNRYGITDGGRAWRALGVASAILAMLLVVPLPQLGPQSNSADAQRVTAAQQRVEAMQVPTPGADARRRSDLDARTDEQLQALRDALARTTTSTDAARALEQAQQQLARLPNGDDYAARRSVDAVASALEAQQDDALIPLAQALRVRDEHGAQQALGELEQRPTALQAAANAAAASNPRLAGALRRAAGAPTDKDLQQQLSQSIADASALDRLEQNMANLGQLRAATLPAGATLVPATGTPTGYALASGTPPANATPVGFGMGASAPGGGASPNGTQPYDPVFSPTHLGGDPGPQVQVGGDPSDARGERVDLPRGPLTAGDVRPYDQVYAQYAQEARQSVSRQSLPPNVQSMVDRYFGAIAPTPGSTQP
jgi:hypothetical protein